MHVPAVRPAAASLCLRWGSESDHGNEAAENQPLLPLQVIFAWVTVCEG